MTRVTSAEVIALAEAIAALARGNQDHSYAISELSMTLYRRLTPYSRGRRERTIGRQDALKDAAEAVREALERTRGRGEDDSCAWLQGCAERLELVVGE